MLTPNDLSAGYEPVPITFVDLLEASPGETAFVEDERDWSYDELRQAAHNVAARLISLGVKPTDRVALVAGNSAAFAAAQYGIFKSGAICVALNTRLTPTEWQAVLKHSGSRFAVADSTLLASSPLETIHALKPQLPELELVVDSHQLIQPTEPRTITDFPEVRADDPAILVYTSGTTGRPKGCLHSHRSYANSAIVTAGLKGLTADDRILASVPMFNAFGTLNCLMEAFVSGATVINQTVFEAGDALARIQEHGVTDFLGTPTMWMRLLQHAEFAPEKVSTLRTGIMAGAVPPQGLSASWLELGCQQQQIFGMSEATSILIDGKPCPGIEVQITPDGELISRGFNQMLEYFRDPAATAEKIRSGWVYSGDLVDSDLNDSIRITGRKDELIITGGFNVTPAEVEDVLRAHSSVADAAAFSFPDEDLGQVVAAVVVPATGQQLDFEQIMNHCRERLANYKLPKYLRSNAELALTSNGKVQRFRHRQDLLDELKINGSLDT